MYRSSLQIVQSIQWCFIIHIGEWMNYFLTAIVCTNFIWNLFFVLEGMFTSSLLSVYNRLKQIMALCCSVCRLLKGWRDWALLRRNTTLWRLWFLQILMCAWMSSPHSKCSGTASFQHSQTVLQLYGEFYLSLSMQMVSFPALWVSLFRSAVQSVARELGMSAYLLSIMWGLSVRFILVCPVIWSMSFLAMSCHFCHM